MKPKSKTKTHRQETIVETHHAARRAAEPITHVALPDEDDVPHDPSPAEPTPVPADPPKPADPPQPSTEVPTRKEQERPEDITTEQQIALTELQARADHVLSYAEAIGGWKLAGEIEADMKKIVDHVIAHVLGKRHG